jgi:hypothetical protein
MSRAVNLLLVKLAHALNLSPGVVHVLLLGVVTVAYGAHEYHPFSSFSDPVFLFLWFAVCSAAIAITWLTKGEYRAIWWQAAVLVHFG